MPTNRRETTQHVLRFLGSERMVHWSIAVPFLVCLASATVLVVVYNPNPDRPYREIFSWIHRIAAVGFIVFPPLSLVVGFREARTHLANMFECWLWTRNDFKWILLKPFSLVSKRVSLPEEGKFNAGEKINFMMVSATWPLFVTTGLLIWYGQHGLVPWLAHFATAVVAAPVAAGHIFMATINPDTRPGLSGMLSGWVDRGWASHHYRSWFRQEFAGNLARDSSGRADLVPAVAAEVVRSGLALGPAILVFALSLLAALTMGFLYYFQYR